jgi:S-DNA-T family DNA segregation ATPase FtsK/SpoIIIE
MTELNQANGHGPLSGRVIPAPRDPQDDAPPGLWRGAIAAPPAPLVPLAPQAETAPARVDLDEVEDDEPEQQDTVGRARKLVRVVRTMAGHAVTRAVVRQGVYVGLGAHVAYRRRRDERTTARHERMMRAAESTGNHEALLEWEARAATFRRDRHERRMALLAAPVHIARGVVFGVPVATAILLVIGILAACSSHHIRDVVEPFVIVAAIARFLISVLIFAYGIAPRVAVPLVLGWLWHTGRSNAETYGGGWMAALKPASSDSGMIVTADVIVRALQHMGIAKLNEAFKAGWLPMFHLPPVKEGTGYHAIFETPLGVTPGMLADKNELLARNLGRSPIEVWAADAAQEGSGTAGYVDLYVADVGSLNKPAPEYPLLHAGSADVFGGVPAGVTPRGEALMLPVVGNNGVFGGRMGQGKSNAVRCEALGVALDPLAELRVYVFAGNGDFDAYAPRLARYERGVTDDVVRKGAESLRELYEEVGRRETRLAELGAKKLTRQIAQEHPDLRPLWVAYSECHVMFGHKEHGQAAEEYAVGTLRRGRKTGIKLVFDTQSSRANAIPGAVVELMSVNACFSVKNWRSNDGFLGDGSFQAGIRATVLRPGKDRGTSLITGVSDELYEILKWYFIEVDDDTGFDAATDVIARAMRTVDAATPVRDSAPPAPLIEERDLLADILQVLGTADSLSVAVVASSLQSLAPNWLPYQKLTGKNLRDTLLREHGIKVPSTGGAYPVTPALIRKALTDRRPAAGGE